MQKILLFSHSGFSDENANGITMKNLLSAWGPEEKAEFYCDVEQPDFSAAHHYFRVTDTQMIKAFFGKKSRHILTYVPENAAGEKMSVQTPAKAPRKIPAWLKKHKYNFFLKWLREYLWMLSPWGHRSLEQWIRDFTPDVLVYMVGESIFMDKLVLKVCAQTGRPLVLYHGEAFRIIDLKTRRGLDRAYYRKVEALYAKLAKTASLAVYNCEMLKRDYEAMYPGSPRGIVAYNSADCGLQPYAPKEQVNMTYFGNLGVGRSEALLRVADLLGEIDGKLMLDIYGNATAENAEKFKAHKQIRYHGFIGAAQLRDVMEASDILLHVESFDETIMPKLKYAFSTKIAQCLCAGRCFVSYAPRGTASTQYLLSVEGPVVVSSEEELSRVLARLVKDPVLRLEYAGKARETGLRNHNMQATARKMKEQIQAVYDENEHET